MEEREKIRKKLIFRSWHRGTREMDLIMGRFAQTYIPGCSDEALAQYEALLQENDPDLYDWITGKAPVPEHCAHAVMQDLMRFHGKK